jgi:ATP-binding cassette subfamily C protein LapB
MRWGSFRLHAQPKPISPMDQAIETATKLQLCLQFLTEQLGHKLGQSDLYRVFDNAVEEYTVEDAVKALEHAGYSAEFGKAKVLKIDPILLPVISFDGDGNPFVVMGQDETGGFVVVDAGAGDTNPQVWNKKDKRLKTATYILRINRAKLAELGAVSTKGHWFWSAFTGLRGVYIQVVIAALVANVLGLTTSIFTMVVYDRILPNEAIDSLVALAVGVSFALIFDFLIKSLRARFIDSAGKRADERMGERLFNQLLSLKMRARKTSNGHMASVMRDFEVVREFFTSASLVALVDLPFVLLFVAVIYIIGGPLALVPAVAIPVVLICGILVQPFLRRMAQTTSDDGQTKQAILMETLSGMETLKSTGAEAVMRARWKAAVKSQSDSGGKSRLLVQGTINLTVLVQQVAQIAIVFYGVFLIRDGLVSMGALIACVILTGKTLAPLGQVSQVLTRLHQASVAYRQVNAMMAADVEREAGHRYLSRPKIAGKIELKDVSFGYDAELGEVLNDISLTIEPGEKVAIMGPVGSGKSTLARLILGLYEPDQGSVLLDGLDSRAVDPADRTRNIGAVLQDCWLFSGTLQENIVAGRFGVTDDEVHEKARIASVDQLAAAHPHGYDMKLRENGAGISGGQKQTIALARALIGDPSCLVVDEPTSGIDVQSEAQIISNLQSWLTKERTLVLITHRTSLLRWVDRVIVLKGGTISFDGNKDELLKQARKAGA